MIKNTGMVNLPGLMAEYIKDNGKMGNNMEKEFILIKVKLKERENGMKEKELNGLNKLMILKT